MSNKKMWMVRCESGELYYDFKDKKLAAIGWSNLAPKIQKGQTRKEVVDIYKELEPKTKERTIISGASQVWRFVNEIEIGDWIVTYSPLNRTYLIGQVESDFQFIPDLCELGMGIARCVKWNEVELLRDVLSTETKNTLGSTLTVFNISEYAMLEILKGGTEEIDSGVKDAEVLTPHVSIADPLNDLKDMAFEKIKDKVNTLSPNDMELLVAGILRSMGYKTQVAPNTGSDRGKDIIASPDGFGFENPRIVVEVKHRIVQIGSTDLRSFIGGRHPDDRGLYVSTGGFTKDARYEAERSKIPLSLWTLDDLVRTLVEHYEQVDTDTKLLVPLRKVFIPMFD